MNHNVKIDLSIDEIILIIHCVRNSILNGSHADMAVKLVNRLDKILTGI